MITEKERFKEWLSRVADDVYALRRKPRLSRDKKLEAIRSTYAVLSVLVKVANREAYMLGIPPIEPLDQ